VEDVLIAVVDGLKGFPEAIAACSASAPMRHLGLVEEWRISGSA
jgi:transposase-like protein